MARLEPDVLLVGFESLNADDVRALGRQRGHGVVVLLRRALHRTAIRSRRRRPGDVFAADWNDASWRPRCSAQATGSRGRASASRLRSPAGTPGRPRTLAGKQRRSPWILLQYPFRRGMRAPTCCRRRRSADESDAYHRDAHRARRAGPPASDRRRRHDERPRDRGSQHGDPDHAAAGSDRDAVRRAARRRRNCWCACIRTMSTSTSTTRASPPTRDPGAALLDRHPRWRGRQDRRGRSC